MTIERACEILNQAKWRERDDWQINENDDQVYLPWAHLGDPRIAFDSESAIAIATGIEDRRRVVELEAELALSRIASKAYRTDIERLRGDEAQAQFRLAHVTEERNTARQIGNDAITKKASLAHQVTTLEQELAALRLAREPFLKVARFVVGLADTDIEAGRKTDASRMVRVEVAHCRTLLATEPKEGERQAGKKRLVFNKETNRIEAVPDDGTGIVPEEANGPF